MVLKVAVVGGGIGGLTLAQLIRIHPDASNIEISIFDRDADAFSRFQGWFMGIIAGSVEIFSPLFADNPLLSQIFSSEATDNKTTIFRVTDLKNRALMQLYASGIMFADRVLLRRSLLANVHVNWDRKFVDYDTSSGEKISITFKDSTGNLETRDFDILVGADGANSEIRAKISPELVYNDLGYTTVGGSVAYSKVNQTVRELTGETGALNRWLGPDGYTIMIFTCRRGLGNDSELLALWVLSFPAAQKEWAGRFADQTEDLGDEYATSTHGRNELLDHVLGLMHGRFPPEVVDVVAQTDPAQKLFGPRQIFSVDPARIKSLLGAAEREPRVVLLGDAAHATTTHRGMGANLAIADAADLARALGLVARDLAAAGVPGARDVIAKHLRAYNHVMVERSTKVALDSTSRARSFHVTGFSAELARSLMLKFAGWYLYFVVPVPKDPLSQRRIELDKQIKRKYSKPNYIGLAIATAALSVGIFFYRKK